MLRNSTQHVCLNGLVTAALLCGAAAARVKAPAAGPDLIVYLTTEADLPRSVLAPAKQTATEMFAGIGVRVAWAKERADDRPPAGVVLHVVITERPQGDFEDGVLAFAHPFAGGTKAIVIMWNRVKALCQTSRGLAPSLLAHVITQEITHVLEGVNDHSATGVMKARWNVRDQLAMSRKPLPFTDDKVEMVRSGLVRMRTAALANADPSTRSARGTVVSAGDHRIQAILLQDFAGVPAAVLEGAKTEAARIFLEASVGIEWIDCPSIPDEAGKLNPCPPPPSGAIVLRIVSSRLNFLGRTALGYAAMAKQDSFYATVSYPRVRECTNRQTKSKASLKQVLGHAIAHELGHILLGAESHASAGLMRAEWDASQLEDASRGCLRFSSDEAKRIQDALARRVREGVALLAAAPIPTR